MNAFFEGEVAREEVVDRLGVVWGVVGVSLRGLAAGEGRGGQGPETGHRSGGGEAAFRDPAGRGLCRGLVIIGAGLGIGRIGASAVESMARQPEVAGNIQGAMIIAAALVEGVTFFALLVCYLLG